MLESKESLRILIVSESASAQFGGEAALPLHYFRILRRRGCKVWLVVHARTRDELSRLFPGDANIEYVPDTPFHIFMHRLGTYLPHRVALFTTSYAMRLTSQRAQRRLSLKLISRERINVVHQPVPVSPREPSMMYDMGVPVIIGPMNGGMDFPPAFRDMEPPLVRRLIALGRAASVLMNRVIPGKLKSELLLVANERTSRSLPTGVRGRVVELVENGVDMSTWGLRATTEESRSNGGITRFIFMGRLVDWKAVDLLLEAFRGARESHAMSLMIVGDGSERPELEEMARRSDMRGDTEGESGKVFFAGWQSQEQCASALQRSDALVLPSLMECGGAVVLEAMAAGRAVIATDWGGPADYLDPSCGILVAPTSRGGFVAGLRDAMMRLANTPNLSVMMGMAGHRKVCEHFDWEVKVDGVMNLYREVAFPAAGPSH